MTEQKELVIESTTPLLRSKMIQKMQGANRCDSSPWCHLESHLAEIVESHVGLWRFEDFPGHGTVRWLCIFVGQCDLHRMWKRRRILQHMATLYAECGVSVTEDMAYLLRDDHACQNAKICPNGPLRQSWGQQGWFSVQSRSNVLHPFGPEVFHPLAGRALPHFVSCTFLIPEVQWGPLAWTVACLLGACYRQMLFE